MPQYDVNSAVVYNHTVQAENEDLAYEEGQDEAAAAFCRHYGLPEGTQVEVFEDVTDLDQRTEEGAGLYVLSAFLGFFFQVEADDADDAGEKADALTREAAKAEYGIDHVSVGDLWVFDAQERE